MDMIYATNSPLPNLRAKHVRGLLATIEAETSWVEQPVVAFINVAIADAGEVERLSVYVTREASGLIIRQISLGRP